MLLCLLFVAGVEKTRPPYLSKLINHLVIDRLHVFMFRFSLEGSCTDDMTSCCVNSCPFWSTLADTSLGRIKTARM